MLDVEFEDRAARRFLDGVHDRLNRPEQLLDGLVDRLHDYERDVFESAGQGSWPELAAGTVARKGSGRILLDSGDMFDQLTSSKELHGDEAEVTAPAYFRFHKTGTGRMPRRDPAPEPPSAVVDSLAEDLIDQILGSRR